MTSLAATEAEAARLVGRLPEPERRSLQQSLADLCETHWHELRGAEPATPLARALWAITPPHADLCADLHARHDARLDAVLQGRRPSQAFALLALAAIERGDAEAARAAHAPMMLFDSAAAGSRYADAVAALLRGGLAAPQPHRHEALPPLAKALNLIAAHILRCDLPAVVATIGLLIAADTADPALKALRAALMGKGVRFTGVGAGQVEYELHGRRHKPATLRELGETLHGIRQSWLG